MSPLPFVLDLSALYSRALALRAVGGDREAADRLLRAGRPATAQLSDGTTAWYARPARKDDCFAAAIATALQVPLREVPDPNIDFRLARGVTPDVIEAQARETLDRWLRERNLRMRAHAGVPPGADRWIGIVGHPQRFQSHCLVMGRREVLFDPVDSAAYERTVRRYSARDVTSGLSFEPIHYEEE